MSRITVKDLNNSSFYQVPKGFLHNPRYISMKSESKLAYAVLKDLLDLSVKNGWINSKGEIYVKISRDKLRLRLNIKGTQKMTQVMDELKELKLIEEVQIGLRKCNEIYICHVEDLGVIYDDSDILNFQKQENEKRKKRNIKNKKSPKVAKKDNSLRVLKIKSLENKISDFRKSKVLSFENQKSRVLKIKNISILSTTNTKNLSSSSSKVLTESNNLVDYFNENICELKKTTRVKFEKFIENKSIEFVKALIDYQSEIGTRSYAGFAKAMENFKDLETVEELNAAIEKFRISKKYKAEFANKTKKSNKNKVTTFDETRDQQLQSYRDLEALENGWIDDEDLNQDIPF